MKTFKFLLLTLLLVSCNPSPSSISLIQGDISIDVLVSNNYNALGHDLTGVILSLKDNPDAILFDYSSGVEPGQIINRYVKVRSQSNYPIKYDISFELKSNLNGSIFFFKLMKLDTNNIADVIFDTTGINFSVNHKFLTPSEHLLNRGLYNLYQLQLEINPEIGNEFNQENPTNIFSYSVLFSGEYLEL